MTLEARSRRIIAQARDKLAPIEHIRREVREMDHEDIVNLAVAYLYAQVKQSKRRETLVIERSAERAVRRPLGEGDPMPSIHDARDMDEWWEANRHDPVAMGQYKIAYESLRQSNIAAREAIMKPLHDLLESKREEWRMDWTRDLLASKFSLGDGTTATWGEATAEQHKARMVMHKRNAQAGVEGYIRHRQAVEDMEAAGASCLNDAVMVTA